VSPKKIHLIFLPFNLVAKSATADFVLFNSVNHSVFVEVKNALFAKSFWKFLSSCRLEVSKSFEVAEPFHPIKNEPISHILNLQN
jgi:hypothetical protein